MKAGIHLHLPFVSITEIKLKFGGPVWNETYLSDLCLLNHAGHEDRIAYWHLHFR